MVVITIIGYRELFLQLMGSNLSGESYYFEQYFSENTGMLILVGFLLFLLFSAVSIVSYLYPVFYMKRLTEGKTDIKTDEILGDFKKNAKKIIIYYLGMMFVVMPLCIIVILISYVLILILIGIVLMLFVFPFIFNFITFLSYDYFNTDKGFFESMGYAMRAQFSYDNKRENSPFWKYWGATIINFLIYNIITSIFTMIPMMFFYAALLTNTSSGDFEQNPLTGTFGIVIFIIYGVSLLVSFILMNLLYVNSGLMYYDSRTDLHQKMEFAEIETIGVNE
ncbi:DUF4013 domain-containing protein [Chryseobacterium sp.]|uniref:DUF4013 domain-containing protein n=1 Tax=Chryseobacterium sp. TaxID=1871047 RepID=UPI0025C11DAF|nr:DUF4013 domain-containing protein [Chryseobacterium sp.]